MADWTQAGVAGILIVLVLNMVFQFLIQWRNRNNGTGSPEFRKALSVFASIDWKRMAIQNDDLHKWHNKVDNDGVPVWYVRKSLEEAVSKLADNIDKQTEVLQSLVQDVRDVRREVIAKP